MLTLDKHLLKMIQTADRLAAFKEGARHFLTVYPYADRWDVMVQLDIPGSRVTGSALWGDNGPRDDERGKCAASLSHSTADVFQLLRVGDAIALEWWPYCNSPWLDKRGLTRDLLRLLVDRKTGKTTRRLELHLIEDITGEDNASIRICKGFPAPKRTQDAA